MGSMSRTLPERRNLGMDGQKPPTRWTRPRILFRVAWAVVAIVIVGGLIEGGRPSGALEWISIAAGLALVIAAMRGLAHWSRHPEG